jgi:type IV secretion system protein TrbL
MNPFEHITHQFFDATVGWQAIGLNIAKEIFVVLALIQLIWSVVLWMFNRNTPDEALIDLLRKMIILSIFWQIIVNYNSWIPSIVDSLRAVGQQMTHTTSLYPYDVFKKGITISSAIFSSSKNVDILDNIFGSIMSAVISLVIFVTFTRIAIEMILIVIGSRIILIGGIIILGFAGSQWTHKYAERYFATAINFGIKMLFITLIVGLGESLSNTWVDVILSANSDNLIVSYYSIFGASLVYGYLAIRIPDMAATMLTGETLSIGFPGAISSGIRAARNTINTGQVATAAVQTAGGTIASGAKATFSGVKKTGQYLKKNNAESSEYIKNKFPKNESSSN